MQSTPFSRRRSQRPSFDISKLGPSAQAQLAAQGVKIPKVGRYKVSAPDQRTVDGILFASKLEAGAYVILRDAMGKENVLLQREFVLQEAFTFEGKKFRAMKYRADFVIRIDGVDYVLDTKGHETRAWIDREKLFVKKYQQLIVVIKNLGALRTWLVDHGVKI